MKKLLLGIVVLACLSGCAQDEYIETESGSRIKKIYRPTGERGHYKLYKVERVEDENK